MSIENHAPAVVMVEDGVASGAAAPEPASQLGSLAHIVRARLDKLEQDRIKTFDLPGWEGVMRLVAKKFTDQDIEKANSVAKTIFYATHSIEVCNEGEWSALPNGWRGVAELMGRDDLDTSAVISLVLDNPTRARDFSAGLLFWMTYSQQEIERDLGE